MYDSYSAGNHQHYQLHVIVVDVYRYAMKTVHVQDGLHEHQSCNQSKLTQLILYPL